MNGRKPLHEALAAAKLVEGSGGSGGTSDYTQLTNKPSINGTILIGNKTLADLGIEWVWRGTRSEYEEAKASIPPKTFVDITDEPDMDNFPTQGSLNPVTSNGLYTELSKLKVINENPENHNGIYRGKDLTNIYTIEQIYERVHDGSFEDLYLGDYFTVHLTTDLMTRFTGSAFESGVDYYEMGGGTDVTARTWTLTQDTEPQSGKTYATKLIKTENVDLMIAHFDYYYNTGDIAVADHHVILIPKGAGFATTAKMNATNTTVGAYFNSDMHQIVLPCYAASLKTALNSHIVKRKTVLSSAINASTPSMAGMGLIGATVQGSWSYVELQLMSEPQIYGSCFWSSSAEDTGMDIYKLAVFNFINHVHDDREDVWLKSVVNASGFAYASRYGNSYYFGANSFFRVRPIITFG